MRRRTFTRALGASLAGATFGSLRAAALAALGSRRARAFAVGQDIDGIVIRGAWRAHVALGAPKLTLVASDAALAVVSITRANTTLTVAAPARKSGALPELHVTLARLRGIATSGSVRLAIDDRSAAPLFLDLAGAGTARGRGSIPLLRVTTSGTVSADLTALTATTVRVHARQASRLAVRTRNELTIVALDTARVTYGRGTSRPRLIVRNAAVVEPL